MTRKDYEIIAKTLREYPGPSSGMALRLARAFAKANPRFNMVRFLTASGMTELDAQLHFHEYSLGI